MIRPIRTSPPAELPVSLEEFKAQAVIDFADDDALAGILLDAAVAHLDGYTGVLGRCLVSQDWAQGYRDWADRLQLPFPDVSSVTVSYRDENGADQTVDGDLFEVVDGARGAHVVFRDEFSAPSLADDREFPVSISFTAGYGAAGNVPGALKVAIMMLAAHWYAVREAGSGVAVSTVPLGFDALIAPYRRVGV
ncbi:phage head-tail connector protein [Salipiger thiooxidans]|uniref:head-tail connector protein n=1 Tax=Salipiger thiooxidans TaxID=282683 RepID=UPI001A90106B|nr:head-tail connector protein [Salipiger thiooxidans]MBN8187604.1 phage head-tail connector protein [Salipiger thiooxidans]